MMMLPPSMMSTDLLPVLMIKTFFRFSCTSRPVAKEEPCIFATIAVYMRSAERGPTNILCAASYNTMHISAIGIYLVVVFLTLIFSTFASDIPWESKFVKTRSMSLQQAADLYLEQLSTGGHIHSRDGVNSRSLTADRSSAQEETGYQTYLQLQYVLYIYSLDRKISLSTA